MSLISFSATRSRPAAWLALLAVLLLFVAPVISKSLAQLRGDEMTMGDERVSPSATLAGDNAPGKLQPGTDRGSRPAHLMSAGQHDAASHPMSGVEHHTASHPMAGPEHHAASHPMSDAGHSAASHPLAAEHLTSPHQASDAEPHHPGHPMSAAGHRAMMAMGMMMSHHPMSMMDDSACGYCVLLIHLALTLALLPLLWCLLQAATPPAVPLFQAAVVRFVPRFFHPRAPPAFC